MVCRDCLEPGHVSCVDGEEGPGKESAHEAQGGSGKARMVCRDCLEPGHVSCVDGEEGPGKESAHEAQGGSGKARMRATSRFGGRPAPYQGPKICRAYNTLAGCQYTNCRFEHCCGACQEKGHMERDCPRGQQAQGGVQHGSSGPLQGLRQGSLHHGGGQPGVFLQMSGNSQQRGSHAGQPFRRAEGEQWHRL
jgi:hypothetical protein